MCQSRWPRGLRRRFAASRLLRLWVRIPPGTCLSVCCGCCVLSGRGLCDELITRPEKSYRLRCVTVCDLETSWMRRPWPTGGCCANNKQTVQNVFVHPLEWLMKTKKYTVSEQPITENNWKCLPPKRELGRRPLGQNVKELQIIICACVLAGAGVVSESDVGVPNSCALSLVNKRSVMIRSDHEGKRQGNTSFRNRRSLPRLRPQYVGVCWEALHSHVHCSVPANCILCVPTLLQNSELHSVTQFTDITGATLLRTHTRDYSICAPQENYSIRYTDFHLVPKLKKE